jgi:hypothetical protein
MTGHRFRRRTLSTTASDLNRHFRFDPVDRSIHTYQSASVRISPAWVSHRKTRPAARIARGTTPRHFIDTRQSSVLSLRPRSPATPAQAPVVPAAPRSAGASTRTAAASGDSPPAEPVVAACLTSRPPVLTRRCQRLVSDHVPIRVGRTSAATDCHASTLSCTDSLARKRGQDSRVLRAACLPS